ncbi:MAG: HAMP domain-containing histidine kinase [Lachnospiraceae bacterium]|nr:HAMP domain-containing histidine kinase [Lachnospiraceae bacterium]
MYKSKKKSRIFSIRTKLTLITIIIITSIVFLTWLVNKTFIQSFYEKSKLDMLNDTYKSVEDIFSAEEEGRLNEEAVSKIERISSVNNVNIYVFNFNRLFSEYNKVGIDFQYPVSVSNVQNHKVFDKIAKYVNNGFVNETEKVEKIEGYTDHTIYKVYDEKISSYDIELVGELSTGQNIYISSNLESIKESADISNRFLAYVGIVAVIIGIIVMLIVSKSFSKPILELAQIADRMSKLDFDAKYNVSTKDEIGQLGESINILSDRLKTTIGELKTANNELTKDIEHKTQIDEMRKEFLSNVSHELKTPIALIQGYAEGLQENVSDDVESRNYYCEVIIDEAAKMNAMVKKLLDLNHIEFGDNKVDIQRFDITSVINGIIASSSILIEQKEAKVLFGEKEEYVWADEYMIEEVITNYLSNALNHVSISEEKEKDAEKIINIYYEKKEKNLRVCIYNTGQHIPEAELEKVWIKFYKVDKARTRLYGGSGVGLSIVKAIMDSHNRACGVENVKNGVVFWFELECE